MLRITIPEFEQYDERNNEFSVIKSQSLSLEHSLVSLSKWESKWCKPFLSLSKENKSTVETVDYIQCMTLTQNVNPIVYLGLTIENIKEVTDYIESPMTATIIKNKENVRNREIFTAEIIYYWMISLNIPFECQKWHLNKLLTLISVCNIKNQPAKKMSGKELMSRNASLNAARRQALNTRG